MTPQQERQIYEKWKSDHPDVTHENNATPAEWYVRNYVEYRLMPALEAEVPMTKKELENELDAIHEAILHLAKRFQDGEHYDLLREVFSILDLGKPSAKPPTKQ